MHPCIYEYTLCVAGIISTDSRIKRNQFHVIPTVGNVLPSSKKRVRNSRTAWLMVLHTTSIAWHNTTRANSKECGRVWKHLHAISLPWKWYCNICESNCIHHEPHHDISCWTKFWGVHLKGKLRIRWTAYKYESPSTPMKCDTNISYTFYNECLMKNKRCKSHDSD